MRRVFNLNAKVATVANPIESRHKWRLLPKLAVEIRRGLRGIRECCCISQWHCQPSKCRLALAIKKFCQVKLPKIANCLDYALFKDTNQREEQERRKEATFAWATFTSCCPVCVCGCVWVLCALCGQRISYTQYN